MPPELILDRFRYLSRLGAGGSSTVTLAEDTLLGRRVALKRVHAADDVTARSRLRREALIGASLSHPNLVSIYDILTTEDGDDVIVMEYVEGETLAAALRRGARPNLPTTLAMLDGVAAALDAIHAQGIIHRDVKPANILLGTDGATKLGDLGIAAVPDRTRITTAGALLGTFSYMAPEQLEGATATAAIDIYALAAVAFEALSGERARHEPNPLALAHAIATHPPPDLRQAWPQAPTAAADVLNRAMARDPRLRPRSAGELVRRLRAALEPQPTAVAAPLPRPAGPARRAAAVGERARRPARVAAAAASPTAHESSRPHGRRLAAAAALLAALAVAAIVLANSGGSPLRLASHSASPHTRRRASVASAHAKRSAPRKPATTTRAASPAARPPAAAGVPPAAGPAPTSSTPGPVNAVETFYRLAASHQYAAAWALTDPAFRQQLEGYQGLESTMAQERRISFNGANVINQSPSSATVAVRTTSVRTDGTQSCSGTVNLLRAASATPGWLLDHIQIQCAYA